MPRFINLEGQQFGRLLVKEQAEHIKGRTAWRCLCDCGTEYNAVSWTLLSGHTKSCGCWKRDNGVEQGKRRVKHGMTNSQAFTRWRSMISRCENPKNSSYARYGGRGITICSEWRNSFEQYLSDVGFPPFEGAQLDRIDNDGNYEPSNVRWSSPVDNANNRSCSFVITVDGVSRTLSQWARERSMNPDTLKARLVAGWSPDAAVFTPVRGSLTIHKRFQDRVEVSRADD